MDDITKYNYLMKLQCAVSEEEREAIKLQKQKEEALYQKPLIQFKGSTSYVTDYIDTVVVSDKLITLANNTSDILVIGFDMEWPVTFLKTATITGKVALIQICPDLTSCYLIQISELMQIPKELPELLAHPKIRLAGVNIKNDIRKLSKDFSNFDCEKIMENCIDCGVLANQILSFKQTWSMKNLVKFLLKMDINKDVKLRLSKWDQHPLSKEQLDYAATDAYASLVLYNALKKKEEDYKK